VTRQADGDDRPAAEVDARHSAAARRQSPSRRHGRACAGHPRLWCILKARRGCPAQRPGM